MDLALTLGAFVLFGWLFFCLFRLSSGDLSAPQFGPGGYSAGWVSEAACSSAMCGFLAKNR